jgi:hypothetical protein
MKTAIHKQNTTQMNRNPATSFEAATATTSVATKSAKGDVKYGTINNVPYVSKRAKGKTAEDAVLVFNELSGHELIQGKFKSTQSDSVDEAVTDLGNMIPQNMYVNPQDSQELWIQAKGNSDIDKWTTAIYQNLKSDVVIPVEAIEKSVSLIIKQLREFITKINCPHNDDSVYHCDLHPANVRLQLKDEKAGFYTVTNTYVIDFDMVRKHRCDKFRSSSRMFGLKRVGKGVFRNLVDRPIKQRTVGMVDTRQLTDWAFFYTTCSVLYELLSRVTEAASYAGRIQDYDGCKG